MGRLAALTAVALCCAGSAGCAASAPLSVGGSLSPLAVVGSLSAPPPASLVSVSVPPAPTDQPSPSGLSQPVCSVHRPVTGGRVDARPTGVQAAWLPGLNAHPCRSVLTAGSEAEARRLATDLDHLPPYPPGPIACPADDGTAVELIFAFGSSRHEQIVVELTGCAGVLGAGELTETLRADLLPLAPAAWARYLQP